MNNMYGTTGLDFMKELNKLAARDQAGEQPRHSLKSLILRLVKFPRREDVTVTISLPRGTRAKARGYAK